MDMLHARKYESLGYGGRQALAAEELSDAEIEAIARAEPPAEAAQYDHELTEGPSATGQREAPIK